MTQIAVHLNAPITANLRTDNLGGEWRWERQVLEALLQSDRFEKVCSLEPVWRSSEPMPPKFVDGLPKSEEASMVCIMHDSYHVAERHHFRGLVIQVHQPMDLPCIGAFRAEYGKRFFISYDRAIRTDVDGVHSRMVDHIGPDHVENIANPSVPVVHQSNNFDQNIILFAARGPIEAMVSPTFYWGNMFPWCAEKLRADRNKELHFITGYQQADLDFRGYKDPRAVFFGAPIAQCLLPVQDQVFLHMSMSWSEVLEMYSRTKVVVSTMSTGGSPPEAASYGIPVIGPASSPIGQFPEFLVAPVLSPEYFELTDRLYYDREFYTRIGNAYRDHVERHCTYAAYVSNLTRILSERGMA